jgi:hypothetical protein
MSGGPAAGGASNVSVSWDTLRALGASVAPREQRNGTVAVKVEFAIRADSTPPMLKLDALRDVNEHFRASWDHKNPTIDQGKDGSSSAYEQSIASCCANAGWSDQEIVDTLIYWYRKTMGLGPRATSYYLSTLQKARTPGKGAARPDAEREALAPPSEMAGGGERAGDEDTLLELSAYFNGEVKAVYRTNSVPPEYTLVMAIEAKIGSGEALNSFAKLKAAVTNASLGQGQLEDKHRRHRDQIARALGAVAQPRDLGSEADPREACREWVQSYLEVHEPVPYVAGASHKKEDAKRKRPFIHEGGVWFHAVTLKKWLVEQRHERLTDAEMAERLTDAGCPPRRTFGIKLADGTWYTVEMRQVPPNWGYDAPGEGE